MCGFLCSDDYNTDLDAWQLQLALAPDCDASSVFLVHKGTGNALAYVAHVLCCSAKPSNGFKDAIWRLRFVIGCTMSNSGC